MEINGRPCHVSHNHTTLFFFIKKIRYLNKTNFENKICNLHFFFFKIFAMQENDQSRQKQLFTHAFPIRVELTLSLSLSLPPL